MVEPLDGPEEGFRVTDRRGHAKEPPGVPPGMVEAPEPARPMTVEAATAPSVAGPPLPGDLQPLFLMLANFALLALGASPDPLTGETQVDLAQAEEAIEGLLTLRDRTEGRQTPEEAALLERVLYEVQLRYTAVATG